MLPTGSHADTLDLTGIKTGRHVLWLVLQDKHTRVVTGEPEIVRFVVVPQIFEPRYEWQEIIDGQSVPAGLEIVLDMSGKGKRGRIPPRWQLQIWMAGPRRFFRAEVQPSTTIQDLNNQAAKLAAVAPGCASLTYRGKGAPPTAAGVVIEGAKSAFEARLFEAQSERALHVVLDPTCAILVEEEVDEGKGSLGASFKRKSRRLGHRSGGHRSAGREAEGEGEVVELLDGEQGGRGETKTESEEDDRFDVGSSSRAAAGGGGPGGRAESARALVVAQGGEAEGEGN